MSDKTTLRVLIIIFVIALFSYFIWPTLSLNLMSASEKKTLEQSDPKSFYRLQDKAIKLGLDLQGGIHLVMEVDFQKFLEENAKNPDETFNKALADAVATVRDSDASLVNTLNKNLTDMGSSIARYFGSRDYRTNTEVIGYLNEQSEEAIDRALEVLRNRVDRFGVSEPVIQKQGGNRIVVELAGITDPSIARKLVGETAKLEFRILRDFAVAQRIATRLNTFLQGDEAAADTTVPELAEETTTTSTDTISAEDIFDIPGDSSSDDSSTDIAESSDDTEPFFLISPQGVVFIKASHANLFDEYSADPKKSRFPEIAAEFQKIVGQETTNGKLFLNKISQEEIRTGEDPLVEVYLLSSTAELSGETIIDAKHRSSGFDDPENAGKYEANLTFNDEGTKSFARITGANINKRMAILLDDRVQLAPRINGRIPNGRARITGLETSDEALVLASVLKAGALKVPLNIIEERSVGPSLGKDSINKGTYATLVGLILVMIFMIIYYKLSGVIADIALILNLLILLGAMSTFDATLTLPGIAGIILTIGMAVDANVLIFERIREEMDKGKSALASIDTGYGRAFITILDANITTLIAAVVLYNFGSGPVKGFAITLIIGILASMFTAIFVTRTLYDLLLTRKFMKQISI